MWLNQSYPWSIIQLQIISLKFPIGSNKVSNDLNH